MSTQAATNMAQEVDVTPEEVLALNTDQSARGMRMLDTKSGPITITGADLMPQKFLDLIAQQMDAMANPQANIHQIVFRTDGFPRIDADTPTGWMYFPDARSAVCNIKDCLELALAASTDESAEDGQAMNVWHAFWEQMLIGFYHETHHGPAFTEKRNLLEENADARKAEDTAADEYARARMLDVAKEFDIEPEFTPIIAAWARNRIEAEMQYILEDDDATVIAKAWAESQEIMEKENLAVYIAGEGDGEVKIPTLREFFRHISGDAENDVEWPELTTTAPSASTYDGSQGMSDEETYIMDDTDAEFDGPDLGDEGYVEPNYGAGTYQEQTTGYQPTSPNPGGYQQQNAGQPGSAPQYQPTSMTGPNQQNNGNQGGVNPTHGGGPVYPPIDMPVNVVQQSILGLYQRLAHRIFMCQQNMGAEGPIFLNCDDIFRPEGLHPEESAIVKGMWAKGGDGKDGEHECQGFVTGIMASQRYGIPGYRLIMSDMAGNQIRRKIIPVNPRNKSKVSEMARNGAQIAWIIDEDCADKDKAFVMRVFNGVVEKCQRDQNNRVTWVKC